MILKILQDACWAISYLSDGSEERILAIIKSGVCQTLISTLGVNTKLHIQLPILRIIGNIISGNDELTDYVLNLGVLQVLRNLLLTNEKILIKETCWTLSNITAGTLEQVIKVKEADIFPILIQFLTITDYDIKKEAIWAVSNATACIDNEVVGHLVELGCIERFVALLNNNSDPRMLTALLEAIENILFCGQDNKEGENIYIEKLEQCNGVDIIEKLQQHDNSNVYELAIGLLDNFFSTEDITNIPNNEGPFNFDGSVSVI